MSDNHIPGDGDDAVDPIDRAYAQAERVLADDAARAARRAKVLGAAAAVGTPSPAQHVAAASPMPPRQVAQAAAPQPASPQPNVPRRGARRRDAWRRGGWLTAACVAGLSLFVVIRVYRPTPPPTAVAPATPAAPALPKPAPASPSAPARPSTPLAAPREGLEPTAPAPAKPAKVAAPPPPAAPPPIAPVASSAPTPVDAAPAEAPAPPPPPPPPPPRSPDSESVSEVVVTAERAAPARPRSARSSGVAARGGTAEARDTISSNAAQASAPTFAETRRHGAPVTDLEGRLRAAAAAGRAADIEALLDQGAPIDAPDAEGDTPLMTAVLADHPAAAAVLRRHGASLDRQNHAGESARDMAATKADPALDRALGLAP